MPAFLLTLSLRSRLLLAMLAGLVNVLSFAPFHAWPLQTLSLAAAILLSITGTELGLRAVFLIGWSYTFAWVFTGVSWLLIALTRYGGLPLALSVLALALLIAFLSTYIGAAFALSTYVQRRWRVGLWRVMLLVFPVFWVVAEWLRNAVFTGFPWISSGYAHNLSPLAGFAPLVGVYGIGGLSAGLAALIALTIADRTHWHRASMLLISVFAIGTGLREVSWTHSVGQPISVRLLQGNVAQDVKFDAAHLQDSLRLYHDMIVAAPADLIATPETALPIFSDQLPADYLPRLNQFAQSTGSHIVAGVVVHDAGNQYSNSVLGFAPEYANQAYRYDKHHLVPFGEFVPYGFRWFVNLMHIPLGDFSSAGVLQAPMQVRDQLVMPNICYEDLFGEEIAAQLRQQFAQSGHSATILLNSSNIAWYGDSIAIPQHLQISQMRTLETGRPMLRSTNTGATAVINGRGVVTALLPPLTKGTLVAQVQGMTGMTPYIRYGNGGLFVLCALSLLVALFSHRVALLRSTKSI